MRTPLVAVGICLLVALTPATAQSPAPLVDSVASSAPENAVEQTAQDPAQSDQLASDEQALQEQFGFSPEEMDPWERFNRPIFTFNSAIDRVALRPAAVVYSRVVPRIAQRGVSNFFTNLQQPITSLNLLLQGRPVKFAGSLGRFLLNSTLGLGGILDPATDAGIPPYDQDFGQTLHRWGWKKSRYIMLPFFGPATVRDGVGKGINTRVSPISYLADQEGAEYSLLYGLSARSRGLAADSFLRGGGDEYLLMRDAFMQYRHCQLVDCRDELPDYLLPDFEFEVPDVDALRLGR